MQFLIVHAKKQGQNLNLPVLIDGTQNGYTDNLIKLDEGTIDVSVDYPKSDPVTIDLENTTVMSPIEITIELE